MDSNRVLEEYSGDHAFTEVYEVVHTVDVTMNHDMYRIEVLKDYSRSSFEYVVRYYLRQAMTVQPSFPSDGGIFSRTPESMYVWVYTHFPDVHADTPDRALAQALGFMEGE